MVYYKVADKTPSDAKVRGSKTAALYGKKIIFALPQMHDCIKAYTKQFSHSILNSNGREMFMRTLTLDMIMDLK